MIQDDAALADRSESDSYLARSLQGGDVSAFDEIISRYAPRIYRLALRVLERPDDAEEAVQDIFLRVFDRISDYDPERPFFPWLYTLAANHVRSLRRRRAFRRRRQELPLLDDLLPREDVHTSDPERITLGAEAQRLVASAVRGLRPIERHVFVLRQYEQLSTQQTAELLGIGTNTVKTHLRRARQKIAKKILSDETSEWVAAYGEEKGQR